MLRSYVGTLCLSEWFSLGWNNDIYDHLGQLQHSKNLYHNDVAVLQLTTENDTIKLVAGPLGVQY